ncbi:CBN-SRR-2 protein [Caenorhabditis brenneri]|uniref:CBN-SRR-2 protein n=1 Tax=Caenorhabditis brenneri TaxID=135651 RepID=G0N357_CAEBE|nr:CBN-SRR-2 protein [Caenorhabditis brenneri]
MTAIPEDLPLSTPNIFGFYRYVWKLSPYNCGKGPFRFIFVLFSLASFLSMVFRAWWMFYEIDVKLLSFGWAERNMYAFISMESFSCVISLYFMTSKGTMKIFEEGMGRLKALRVTHYHAKYDEYSRLRLKTFLLKVPILVFFIGSAGFLLYKKIVIFGTITTSSWYFYFDASVMVLCAYVNFIYLPVHGLLHNAMAREFHVFNVELEEASKNKDLVNPVTLQKFADRQIKLFEVTNRITGRLHGFMSSAPFLILTALTNVTFLVTNLRADTPTYYYVCLIGMMICCIIISSNLLYPVANVQEAMLHTSTVLMNDPFLHHSQDPQIYSTYRIMVDRAQKNRTVNLVIQVFSVNRKNVERAYFVITNIVLVMAAFHNLMYS